MQAAEFLLQKLGGLADDSHISKACNMNTNFCGFFHRQKETQKSLATFAENKKIWEWQKRGSIFLAAEAAKLTSFFVFSSWQTHRIHCLTNSIIVIIIIIKIITKIIIIKIVIITIISTGVLWLGSLTVLPKGTLRGSFKAGNSVESWAANVMFSSEQTEHSWQSSSNWSWQCLFCGKKLQMTRVVPFVPQWCQIFLLGQRLPCV